MAMDSTFYRKMVIWLSAQWLASKLRSRWLTFRYVTWLKWCKRTLDVDVYLALNDPYSYLLIQLLPRLEQRFDIKFSLKLISENLPSDTYAAEAWHRWAWHDCQLLAAEYQLLPLTHKPSPKSVVTGQQLWQLQPKTLTNALALFEQTWHDGFSAHYPHSTPVINTLITNQTNMLRQGFYLPASIYCAGEWYWGIDRLVFLELNLTQLIGSKQSMSERLCSSIPQLTENIHQASPCPCPESTIHERNELAVQQPIIFYLSLRSPYSYLGWIKAKALAQKYQLSLQIKPILPLLMRGAKLSSAKIKYLYLDVHRQCQALAIPFDKYAEPLGQGIVNCYQLFPYVEQQNLAIAFFDVMFQAVYVDGVDLSDEHNIKQLCVAAGVDYTAAINYATQHDWQSLVAENNQALTSLDFWEAPCFSYANTHVWGQDRLYRIEQTIIQDRQQAKLS